MTETQKDTESVFLSLLDQKRFASLFRHFCLKWYASLWLHIHRHSDRDRDTDTDTDTEKETDIDTDYDRDTERH